MIKDLVYKPREYPKVWGSEIWIANTANYCGKILILKHGYRCSIHYHKKKDETFYILEGTVLMETNGDVVIMKPGDAIRIRPGMRHRFTGLGGWDSKILEVSTHHDEEDSYRITQSERCNWYKRHVVDRVRKLRGKNTKKGV